MSRSLVLAMAVALGLIATFPATVLAQSGEMTAAEIADAFAKQKTRGLTLAPAVDAAGAASAGGSVGSATSDPTTSTVVYASLPKDEQVNISIRFDFDSAALRGDQKPKLVELCKVMKSDTDATTYRIVGHTDSSGSAAYNQNLSLLRAEEVKRHLASDCGIPADRMIAVGVGAEFPYDAENPGADVNRRVEFQALS